MATTLLIAPGCESLLRANGLATFDDFMRLSASGPDASAHWNRRTFPVELRGADGEPAACYLKRLNRPQPAHLLRDLLRLRRPISQPIREWNHIGQLEQAGVRCMQRVAAGQRTWGGIVREAFLLIRAVPCGCTVADWLGRTPRVPPALPSWMIGRLVVELGKLAAQLDAAGLRWRDAHPKHIYARPHPLPRRGKRWEFWLIDLERLERCDPSPAAVCTAAQFADALWPARVRAGVLRVCAEAVPLFASAARHCGARGSHRADRGRRTGPACAARDGRGAEPGGRLPAPAMLRAVLLAALDRRARRDGDEDASRSCSAADRVTADGLVCCASTLAVLTRLNLDSSERLFAFESTEALTKAGLAAWRRRDRIDAARTGGTALYLKRYRSPPLREQARRVLAGHGARTSAGIERRAIEKLSAAGIPTPRWVAFAEHRRGPWERRSLLLLEDVGGVSLERLAARIRTGDVRLPAAERHALVRRLASCIARMHASAWFHRDLYLSHVFVRPGPDGPQPVLIDVARAIRRRRRTWRWRIKDLAALAYSSPADVVTRADRLRFLRTYLGVRRLRPENRPAPRVRLPRAVRATSGARIAALAAEWPIRPALRVWLNAVARRMRRTAWHDYRRGRARRFSAEGLGQ